MQLQKLRSTRALHLPSTRQRNDGLHENQSETPLSSLIFLHQSQCSKFVPTRSIFGKLFKTAALAALFTAGAALPIFAPRAAFAQTSAQKIVGTWGKSTGSATYIRIRPGIQTPIVAKIPKGTRLMVWGTFNGWYRVETTDQKLGWIYHTLVDAPNAAKLQELSHSKAVEASNRTGDQLLYGTVDQLKKYYATYKAPGAKIGLQKLGVDVDAKTPTVQKVATKPQTNTPPLPRDVAITTAEPKVIEVASTPEKPQAAQPTPAARLSSRKSTAPRSAPAPEKTAAVEPMSPSSLPQISADDIMSARRRHIENQLASRRKTRPTPNSSAHSAIKTAPAAKPVQTSKAKVKPASFEADAMEAEVLGDVYYQASAQKKPSRGGSPRDYAQKGPLGSAVAQQALSYRGMPYIMGASSPKRGFDCSGLIYFLLRSRGYNPPRTAAGFASYGKPVAKKDLKPGDLVLFANTYKRGISHIGIYTGNNNFVHAANRRTGVKSDSLSSPYYSKKYYGARRVQ